MSCELENVPEYLHFNNDKQIFDEVDFLDEHHLYRLSVDGNPIEFPGGTVTSLSCKWNILINEEHLFFVDQPQRYNAFKYAYVSLIRQLIIKCHRNEHPFNEWHKLTCSLLHKPNECDYSHCEINIRHQRFSDVEETDCNFNEVYTYKIWQKKNNLLQGKSAFIKQLRSDYRVEMMKIFCNPL